MEKVATHEDVQIAVRWVKHNMQYISIIATVSKCSIELESGF